MIAFVTDGDQRATLAVVRALGRAGIAVTVGSDGPSSLAGSSRYCARTVRYPSPSTNWEGFRSFLASEMAAGRYRLLLPMTDLTTRLVARMLPELPTSVRVPFPAEEQVALAQDKRRVLLLAQSLGIACPATYLMREGESVEEAANQLPYPVVIKPRFSRYQQNGKWVSGDVQYASSSQDLRQKYAEAHARVPFPLLQERVQGEGRGVFLLVWDGKIKAAFCHRRLREKPPWGGPSVYCESIPPDHKLIDKSALLLEAIGWQGPAMVEFKTDKRDGQPKLMEVNGRFWGSLQLAIDAGINFPVLLFRLATGENVPEQFDYQAGVKSRWLLGDLDQLWIRLTHHPENNGWEKDGISRLRACRDFLKLHDGNTRYDVFRWADRGPGWHACKSYLRALGRSAARRKEVTDAH